MTEHHLEFLSLKEGYTGWSESTLLKMPHCWKSHATARILYSKFLLVSLAELVGLSLTCFQTMKARFFSQPGLKCQDNCSRQINADVFPYLEHKILDIYSIWMVSCLFMSDNRIFLRGAQRQSAWLEIKGPGSSLTGGAVLCPWALLSIGSTWESDPHVWKIVGSEVKNQLKQTNKQKERTFFKLQKKP